MSLPFLLIRLARSRLTCRVVRGVSCLCLVLASLLKDLLLPLLVEVGLAILELPLNDSGLANRDEPLEYPDAGSKDGYAGLLTRGLLDLASWAAKDGMTWNTL